MNVSHETLATAVQKGNPTMTFRERRLLQARDYGGLLVVIDGYIRSTTSMMWVMPLLALLQTVVHGWVIPWRNGWDAAVSLRNIAVMGTGFVLVAAAALSFGVSRLVKLERARVLLEFHLGEGAAQDGGDCSGDGTNLTAQGRSTSPSTALDEGCT